MPGPNTSVLTRGPLVATSITWLSSRAQPVMTVLAKATFDITPSEARVREPGAATFAPFEIVPFKPRADVVLVGHAYAPRGEPARSVVARIVVGEIDKAIEVFGDRTFSIDDQLAEARFVKMSLGYEHAAGGPGSSNPLGIAPGQRDVRGRTKLPNLQPPGISVVSPSTSIDPVGFGPVPDSWWQRRNRLGARAVAWWDRDWRAEPLPDDLDPAFFNAAPADQQVAALRENERIVLENLHPEHPRLVTSLPGLRARAFVEQGASVHEVRLVPDTLAIDTDAAVLTLVFRGQVPLGAQPPSRVVIVAEQGDRVMSWREVEPLLAEPSPQSAVESTTLEGEASLRALGVDPLPFGPGAGIGAEHTPDLPPPERPERPARPLGLADVMATIASASGPTAGAAPAWLASPAQPSAPAAGVAEPSPWQAPPAMAAPIGQAREAGWSPPQAFDAHAPGAWTARQIARPGVPEPPAVVRTGEPAAGALARAAASGAAAASDAAAGAEALAAPPAEPHRAATPARASQPPRARDRLDLVGYDPAAMASVRAHPPFADALRPPSDDDFMTPADVRAVATDVADRRDLRRIFARSHPCDGLAVGEALDRWAADDDAGFEPPLALVEGDLEISFDAWDTLKALIAIVTPLAGSDKKLKELIELAAEVIATPCGSSVADGLSLRIREAFAATPRPLPRDHLDTTATSSLLERRQWKRVVVLGERHVRASFTIAPLAAPVVLYLREAVADRAPMLARFRALAIAEVVPAQEQRDAGWSLRALALVRRFSTG